MTQQLCSDSTPGKDEDVGQRAGSVTTESADQA